MKILFLHTDSFGGFGGIAKFNRDFLSAACCYPDAKVVAVPRLINEAIGQLPDGLIFYTSGTGGKIRFGLAALRAVLTQGSFDLIICGHINLLPVARICQVINGGQLGLVIHGIDAWQPTTSTIVNRLVRDVDFFISVSNFTRQRFCQWSGLPEEKGSILPNCIDIKQFGSGPKNQVLLNRYGLAGKKVILTVGRMSASERYKGFDEVLEILPKLSEELPDIAYLVVGDGDDRPRLEQKARDLGVAERVVFAGKVDDPVKVDHYRLADVFAMPGRGEGFGIVYLEALACGVPCIGSTLDGSQDALLQGELGMLVNPSVLEEVLAALRNSLKTPQGIMPGMLEYFSSTNFKKRLTTIFSNHI